MNANRREFVKLAGFGAAGLYLGTFLRSSYAADASPASRVSLANQVVAACRRLAPHGWRGLFLKLTAGTLDLTAPDLASRLLQSLPQIDRSLPGFEDFADAGHRAIEPGQPALSLLFHAFASPNVLQNGSGQALSDFPTPAEIESVENYVYGAQPPSIDHLRRLAGSAPLGLVVFAREYRSARHTVHRRHADLCFSRTATARAGNAPAKYDPASRDFLPLDDNDRFAFRVLPTRFAAYVAMKIRGPRADFGPMGSADGDKDRDFWVPLHKLFPGAECLQGLDLTLNFEAHFINEKLRKLHEFMAEGHYGTPWGEADRKNFPFVIRDEVIAGFSTEPTHGDGLIAPVPHPLFEKAVYRDKPIGIDIVGKFTDGDGNLWFSSAQIVPDSGDSAFKDEIAYNDGLNPTLGRTAPEYFNARHELHPDGSLTDLNTKPDLMALLKKGGYKAQHYIDFTGDGWVAVACPQLAAEIPVHVPAYTSIAPPDFFPSITQREMMHWWKHEAPLPIRKGVWCIDPLALSDRRMAANVTLPAGFDIFDDTVTTIVTQPISGERVKRPFPAADAPIFSRLPDGSNGVFDPGWDFAQDTRKTAVGTKLYLTNYGLGTPFIEDAKLCAALGSFWPAVAPDATRVFQPGKKPQGTYWPWPAIAPLTDEEIGTAEVPGVGLLPWDGVIGPKEVLHEGRRMMRYADIAHVDYINLEGKLTAYLTAKITLRDYEARIVATAAVYWALGIRQEKYFKADNWTVGPERADHLTRDLTQELASNRMQLAKSKWAVSSFRQVARDDSGLQAALAQTQATAGDSDFYRVKIFRYGEQIRDPGDVYHVLVEIHEPTVFYVSDRHVLFKSEDEPWELQPLFATS